MNLRTLEAAFKGQFCPHRREKKSTETENEFQDRLQRVHRLHCDEQMEGLAGLALIVFCGLADEYLIAEELVAGWLEMEEREHKRYLNLYTKYKAQALDLRERGKPLLPKMICTKVWNKAGMIRSVLRYL